MSSKEVRAGKAFIEIYVRNGLQAGLKAAAASIRGFGVVVGTAGAALTGLAGSFAAPLLAAVASATSAGAAIQDMADRTGMAVESISELAYAADQSGTSIEAVEKATRKMQQAIADAAGGSESAQATLKKLGVSLAELSGAAPDEQLMLIADGIAAIEDPAARTAAAMDIFGKAGSEMLPMLADGSKGLADMRAQARQLGVVMSSDTAGKAAKLDDTWQALLKVFEATKFAVGGALLPAFLELADRGLQIAVTINRLVQEHRDWVPLIAKVAAGVGLVGGGLVALAGAGLAASWVLTGLSTIIGGIVTIALGVGSAVAGAFAVIFSPVTLVGFAVAALGAAFLAFTATGKQISGVFGQAFGRLGAIVQETWSAVVDAFQAGDIKGVVSALGTGLGRALEVVRDLFAALGSVAAGVWERITAAASTAATWAAGVWAATSDWIVASWQSLVSAAGAAWDAIVGGVRSAAAAIPGILAAAWDSLISGVQTVAAAAVNPLGGVFATIGQLLADGLGGGLGIAQGALANLLGPLWVMATDGAAALGGALAGAVSSAVGAVLNLLPKAFGLLRDLGAMVARNWDTIVSTARTFVSALGPVLSGAGAALTSPWQAVKDVAGAALAWVTSVWESGLSLLPNSLRAVVSAVTSLAGFVFEPLVAGVLYAVDLIGLLFGSLVSTVTAPLGSLLSTFGAVWSGLVSVVSSALTGIPQLASDAWDAVSAGAGAAVEWVQSAFSGLVSFVSETFASLVSVAGEYLSAIGQGFSDLVGGISAAFFELVGDAGLAWQGISAALAIGEWQQAWDVAWTSIQLTFFKALAPIQLGWSEFTIGLATLLDGAVLSMRTSWNNVVTFVSSAIVRLMGLVKEALDAIAQFDPTGLSGQLSMALSIDVDGALAVLEEQRKSFEADLQKAKSQRDGTRGGIMSEREQAIQSRIAALEKQRDNLVAGAKDQAQGETLEGKAGEALQGVFDLVGSVGTGVESLMEGFKKRAEQGTASASKAADPIGTFSAQAAQLLGFGAGKGPEEETAKNTAAMLAKQDETTRAIEQAKTLQFTA